MPQTIFEPLPAANSKNSMARISGFKCNRQRNGLGFTLIEVLVVIVVIGILVGLFIPAVMSVYRRTQEFVTVQETQNLNLAIEAFKTKYGFYPPDFWSMNKPASFGPNLGLNGFIPYLNKIAPNHGEFQDADGAPGGPRLIDLWWAKVGSKLGPDSAYVFWLTGLAKNKQYPLTGGTNDALPVFGGVEREVFFEFTQNGRLIDLETNQPLGPATYVATYADQRGSSSPILVFELASLPNAIPGDSNFTQLRNAIPRNSVPRNNPTNLVFPYVQSIISREPTVDFASQFHPVNELFNRTSFQIITAGADGLFAETLPTKNNSPGETFNPALNSKGPSNTYKIGFDARERDNVTNFTEGSMANFINQ
jgi:prepilin-type N-terminal cleavage/methylation domain-containing protein